MQNGAYVAQHLKFFEHRIRIQIIELCQHLIHQIVANKTTFRWYPFFTRGAFNLVQGSREGTLGVDNTIVGHCRDCSGGAIEAQIDQEEKPITSNKTINQPRGCEELAPLSLNGI